MSGGEPWWVAAFGEDYPLVYARRDDKAAEAEGEFAAQAVGLRWGDRVLDAACGAGRHATVLARRGARVVGCDLSPALLRRAARDRAVRLVRADVRALPFRDGAFTAVFSFFTSFGYFDDAGNALAAREVARVAARGGRWLLDYVDEAFVRATLVPTSEERVGDARIRAVRRIAGGRMLKAVEIERPGRPVVTYEESVRLYGRAELESMLAAAGLRTVAAFGAFDGRPAGAGPRLVLVAERTG